MIVTYQYLSPNVLFEPPTTFRAGNPDLYPLNSVTFLQDQQVYIVRTAQGFYAVSAVCTHLGCITQWKPELRSDRLPLSRQQVQAGWNQDRRPGAAAAAAFRDFADGGRGVVGGQAGDCQPGPGLESVRETMSTTSSRWNERWTDCAQRASGNPSSAADRRGPTGRAAWPCSATCSCIFCR